MKTVMSCEVPEKDGRPIFLTLNKLGRDYCLEARWGNGLSVKCLFGKMPTPDELDMIAMACFHSEIQDVILKYRREPFWRDMRMVVPTDPISFRRIRHSEITDLLASLRESFLVEGMDEDKRADFLSFLTKRFTDGYVTSEYFSWLRQMLTSDLGTIILKVKWASPFRPIAPLTKAKAGEYAYICSGIPEGNAFTILSKDRKRALSIISPNLSVMLNILDICVGDEIVSFECAIPSNAQEIKETEEIVKQSERLMVVVETLGDAFGALAKHGLNHIVNSAGEPDSSTLNDQE
jgi:hypothetical protein